MAEERQTELFEEASPRSTVLLASDRMTTVLPAMMEGGSVGDSIGKIPTPEKSSETPDSPKQTSSEGNQPKEVDRTTPTTPSPHEYYTHLPPYPTLTPQPLPPGNYYRYAGQTPEPASPGYHDFFQGQAQAFNTSPFIGAPLSPPRSFMTIIPPNSPLMPPRTEKSASGGSNGVNAGNYPTFGGYPTAVSGSLSSEEAWNGNTHSDRSQGGYPSPQLSAQVLPYTMGRSRGYSFDDSVHLPPHEEHPNPTYSPYQNNVFHQQSWGYPPGAPPDIYSTPASPLQPRAVTHPGLYGVPRHHMGYGPYFPATSPGPPIQTSAHNKGPDGANLFIFHIPNHFTNQDMYRLFEPYGNLLSVRIMVEKESGRSRGFGFVSYDSPEAAALAISKLNGFQVGNKRLKVQHKQIRRQDVVHEREQHGNQDGFEGSVDNRFPRTTALPPPPAKGDSNNVWFNATPPTTAVAGTTPSLPKEPLPTTSTDGATEEDGNAVYPAGAGKQEGATTTTDSSPLGTMSQLASGLPDVTTTTSNSGTTETK